MSLMSCIKHTLRLGVNTNESYVKPSATVYHFQQCDLDRLHHVAAVNDTDEVTANELLEEPIKNKNCE